LILVAVIAAAAACAERGSDVVVVATSWPSAERTRLETEFQAWLRTAPPGIVHAPVRLEWLALDPQDDLVAALARSDRIDVLLGGRISAILRLARDRKLAPTRGEGSPTWLVARGAVIRLVAGQGKAGSSRRAHPAAGGQTGRRDTPLIAFDDPRSDPVALAWAESLLEQRGFGDGYSLLVRAAAAGRRIGRQAGSAQGAIARGEAALAPSLISPSDRGRAGGANFAAGAEQMAFEPPRPARWVEGVAILRDAPDPGPARLFCRFLAEAKGMAPDIGNAQLEDGVDQERHALVADLLGATLVDAQDELWAAFQGLEQAGDPSRLLESLTEPPPWPPASVTRLERDGSASHSGLMETLAREIAPEPAVRAELLRSWLLPPRKIELATLAELARLGQGRLCREPRFRAWLAAEWTAWARQRYRRVARVAHGATPVTASN
jgi:hypothetical protein